MGEGLKGKDGAQTTREKSTERKTGDVAMKGLLINNIVNKDVIFYHVGF